MMKFVILACLVAGSLAFSYRRPTGYDSLRSRMFDGRRNWERDIDFRSRDFGVGSDRFRFPLEDRLSQFDSLDRIGRDPWDMPRSRLGRRY